MSARRFAGRVRGWLLHGAFSDYYRVFVLGWDSVVVEGRSACFLVGFVVVFFGKIVDFGELILIIIALPGGI